MHSYFLFYLSVPLHEIFSYVNPTKCQSHSTEHYVLMSPTFREKKTGDPEDKCKDASSQAF